MRPVKRPTKRYSIAQIKAAVRRHFIKEQNPRCILENGMCFYNKTGCPVGCLLTSRDANRMEALSGGSIVDIINAPPHDQDYSKRKILSHYFNLDDDKIANLLIRLQNEHDDSIDDASFLKAIKQITK